MSGASTGKYGTPTVNIYYDGRMSKEGEFYVKYAVYFDGKQRYYATGIKLEKEDVEFLKKYKSGLTGGVRDEYRRNLWNMIYGQSFVNPETGKSEVGILKKGRDAVAIIGPDFSFETFLEIVNQVAAPKKEESGVDIISDMIAFSATLKETENVGDASIYDSTISSLKRFTGRDELLYSQITVSFLNKYEKWMLIEGKAPKAKKDVKGNWIARKGTAASPTTIGIYVRKIRSMFNTSKAYVHHYPFGKGGYVIPAARNIKKALTKEDIGKIVSYIPDTSSDGLYRDLWLFSYLSNGINFLDVLDLRWSDMDLKNDTIEFVRSKTKQTKKKKLSKVQIDLFGISKDIIDRWGDKNGKHIFPFFSEGMTAARKKAVKSQVVKNTNKYMRRIAEKLGITADITTYTARHSFATILMQSEAPLAFISQKLDHSSISTTQNYLGSFESDQAKKYLANLLPEEGAKP